MREGSGGRERWGMGRQSKANRKGSRESERQIEGDRLI